MSLCGKYKNSLDIYINIILKIENLANLFKKNIILNTLPNYLYRKSTLV